ncbi:CAP family protein [Rippkaea orientalis]|uniref:CAP family protein n=1 Tax=Rippkaea orientalis TaxID=2546366 RepID=UPI0002FBD953|nr:CAP family protein [Rippkaea orientalis]
MSQTNFQQEILTAHNKYRQKVNVSPLIWSNQLANDAQQWANYLASLGGRKLQHDSNTNGQGENLWLGTSKRFSYTQMVDGWGQEKQYLTSRRFTLETVSSTGNWSDVGHYTQIVWKNTKKVGCATSKAGGNDILVCRYSPQGNIIGQPIY